MVRPSERKVLAKHTVTQRRISILQACQTFSVSETRYHYQPRMADENTLIADCLIRLTHEQALNLSIKPRQRLKRHKPEPLKEPLHKNHV